MDGYELIVLATPDKLNMLRLAVPYYVENLNAKAIFIVANKSIEEKVKAIPNATFIDEDSILEGMTKKKIEDIIESISGVRKRVGWYFQQFIKLAWSKRCKDDYYVVIDSDTIPLNPIQFIEDGKYLFTQKIEYNKAYFDTIDTLFGEELKRPGDYSFIAENMIFDCKIVGSLLELIMKNSNAGTTFYEKILYSVDPAEILGSGFSEFETYGCYISQFYPERVQMRKLRTSREAVYVMGSNPDEKMLQWAKKDYDIISLEVNEYSSFLTQLTKHAWFRKIFRMRSVSNCRKRLRSFYRRILHRPDFRFE